jgi:hypothetical protein
MKIGWYFHRLKAMTIAELAHRVAEHWKHRSDDSFSGSLRGIDLGEAEPGVIWLPQFDAAPDALKQMLARDAAALQRGDWKLFGWREVNVGTPPKWQRETACDADIAGNVLAHQLNHRDLPGNADARTVWEINRWSEMVRLAMHAGVNGDLKAVRTAMAWLEDWCEKNPAGHGINWTSPLEAGLRLINFVWFDELVDRCLCALQRDESGTLATLSELKRAQRLLHGRIVVPHAAWVWRYRSFGSSANNHLLGELVGLLHAVKRWPSLERTVCPAGQLWQEISRCILGQFAEDGGNLEQALHYHVFAWEMGWHAARLMRTTDGPVVDRLTKAADFFAQVAHVGEQWEYGDNDDAQIVPLALEREHAVAEWRAWMRGEPDGESLRYWLGAPSAHAESKDMWWVKELSGLAVSEHEGWKLRLDASPLGFGAMAAHGHCDALHISIWDGPHALLIDPGTGGYYGMKERRAELAAWDAHNSPQPASGFDEPQRLGVFLWAQHHIRPFFRQREIDPHALAMHRRANTCDGHACHIERYVKPDKGGQGWIVSDDIAIWSPKDMKSGAEPWKTRWHLAPELNVKRVAPNSYHLTRDGHTWLMSFEGDDAVTEVVQGTASRRYGEFEPCSVIEVTGRSPGCVTTLKRGAAA